MGGAIILMLAGTQILDWYWVVLLAAVSLGVGVYRLRKTIPSTYKLAQRIDRRLLLADTLSTATYFETDPSRGHEAIRLRQREEAETAARTVSLETALPFARPKFAYPAIALAMIAFGLFAIRYAVTGSLSLKPSLVGVAFDHFFPPKQEVAKLDKKGNPLKQPSIDDNNPDSPSVQNEQSPDEMLNAPDAPDENNPQAADNSKESAQKGKQDEQNADQQGENNDKGDKQSNGNDANDDNSKQQQNKDGKQQNSKEGKQGSENQNASLMDKLKDAMSNMLNKMKSSSSKDGQQSQQQDAQNSQKGQKDKGNQSKQGKQDQAKSDSQSDQQSDAGDKKQTADAKGSEKSSDKNASQDSKSGIGSADGDKAAKEAEQLAAMGKISEILGKRAQNVTGEVMVEVGSSKQQLKTPWAQKQATHTEAGSEIHRDEVPLIYQQFVEQYFEEIRKTPAAPKTPKPAAAKPQNPGE